MEFDLFFYYSMERGGEVSSSILAKSKPGKAFHHAAFVFAPST